jgi:hypothetical protein
LLLALTAALLPSADTHLLESLPQEVGLCILYVVTSRAPSVKSDDQLLDALERAAARGRRVQKSPKRPLSGPSNLPRTSPLAGRKSVA